MKQHPKISTILIEKREDLYKFTVPSGAKCFSVNSRNGREFKLSFDRDCFDESDPMSQGNFITIKKGEVREFRDLAIAQDLDVYFSCDTPGEVIEVEYWK